MEARDINTRVEGESLGSATASRLRQPTEETD